MFKFYLDNTLVADPLNWEDFEENIVRDDIIKALLPRYDIRLNFNAAGYSYIYNQYFESGYCKLIELRIEIKCGDTYEPYFNGYIFISDCIFNINRCIVECIVIDDNYGARIYNNKSIKTYLDTAKSKNGIDITNPTQYQIEVFSPFNVYYFADKRNVIMLYDAFKFLIAFMTDGKVGFESQYLDYNTLINVKNDEANKVSIISGLELRLFEHNNTPFISFDDLFQEVNKKFPIILSIIKDTNGNPIVKIENEDYYYNTNSVIQLNNVEDVKQSFDNEKLYANIKFDSQYEDYTGVLYNFPQTRFEGFGKEEYFFATECNTDNTLDLSASFISDTNIIEGVVETDNLNNNYDENIFFIEGATLTPTVLAKANYSPITGGQPWFYNECLFNSNIAERYSLANNIALYLNNSGDSFMATKTADEYLVPIGFPVTVSIATPFESIVSFQDDSTPPNFDTNGNYNNTSYKYTSPANGIYTFETSIKYQIATISSKVFIVYLRYDVYDASNTLMFTYFSSTQNNVAQGTLIDDTLTSIDGFYIPATFYTNVKVCVRPIEDSITIFDILALFTVYQDSYFKTVSIENGGGIYQEHKIDNYFISKYIFDYPLSKSNYDLIKQDLSNSIIINTNELDNKNCWIRKIDRKMSTGETKWELISNFKYST